MSFFGPHTTWNYTYSTGEGRNWRLIIPAAKLSGSVTTIRISLGYNNAPYLIDEMWIGHQADAGDVYDFDGNQKQVTFNGQSYAYVTEDAFESDIITISLSDSKPIIISFYFYMSAPCPGDTTDTTYGGYWKAGSNEASQTDVTGYATSSWNGKRVVIREVFQTPAYELSGTVKEKGSPVQRTLRAYARSTGAFYSETTSNADGSFSMPAPDDTTEMFVIAFDDDAGDQYNALIYDRVKGVST